MKYCRVQDRQNERNAVANLLGLLKKKNPASNWTYKQTADDFSKWDLEIFRDGKLYALVEIKGRTGQPYHAEWHISKRKLDELVNTAKTMQVFLMLIFTWDGVPYAAVPTSWSHMPRTHISGRTDRGAANDWEEMYLIPRELFIKI